MGRLIPAGTGFQVYQELNLEEGESFFKTAKK
jgi:hypothetical protein